MARISKSSMHQRDLESVLLFSLATNEIHFSADRLSTTVDSCMAYIKSNIRTQFPVIHSFLECSHSQWSHLPEVKALFAEYVRTGYINVNGPLKVGLLPLEFAVIRGNLAAYAALIENGADITLSQGEKESLSTDSDNVSDGDIFDFISHHQDEPVASVFTATTHESIMRRQINLAAAESDMTVSPPSALRRRMGCV